MRDGPPILVVEDNLETRRALTAVLGIEGYPVVEVGDGLQALEYLRNSDAAVSLVVLDLHMPRMDGHEFLRIAMSDGDLRNIPIVVYSAVGPERLPGAIPYVQKGSSSPEQLLAVVDRLFRAETAPLGNGPQ